MVFAVATVAAAQDDDATADDDTGGGAATTFEDSYLDFQPVAVFEANSTYEFSVDVHNMATAASGGQKEKLEWIKKVELTMASTDYAVDEANLTAPDPLYPAETDHWDVLLDPTTQKITWEAFGVVSSVEYGDIREGDVLTFTFTATTDAGPSDGFEWLLVGDMGTPVSGKAYVKEGPSDDDAFGDDDNANAGESSGDSGGCGC